MHKNRHQNRSTMLQASCATLALLCSTSAVVAQNTTIIGGSGSSGVYVNEQLIGSVPAYSNGYSYGAQGVPSGYPGAGNNQYLSRPGNLLFPPARFPHSQVTINNFADFQGSGYNQTAYTAQNNPQVYNSWQQRYGQDLYARGGYLQQPQQTAASNLYNPYGQPLVPLSQVSSTHVASTGQQPQYPSQVPASSPQSQLLVPPPNGGNRVVQRASTVTRSTPEPTTQEPVRQTASITPPAAPKVTSKKAEPVSQAQAPSSTIPPAPVAEETQPTKIEPVATPQTVAPKTPAVEATVKATTTAATEGTTFSAPDPVASPPSITTPAVTAPAPAIETVTAEPVLTPPPVPEPTTPTAGTDIPTAPAIAGAALTESTEELSPPPPPPAEVPLTETAPVELLPTTEETAAITPPGELGPLQLLFEQGEADLGSEAKAQLNTLADQLLADESKIIQLLAYAGDSESNAQARRISLSRALAVRGVLMERGIPSTRMHVRALGNKAKNGNPDRVEIIPVQN
ncbi:OmpA family protein [Kiloniella sp. EL199]|uniref:OmpA family protein n=1 Tax=Kiloniella sp. EL199 TaxID=2107581 RepID=UPI001C1F2B8C|nr:OmpA family protein [Kiloniella sp. EL199]